MQHLQQQLHTAEEEHRSLQARLEASTQAAAAKEAEAAAAAKAEQAALQAAAEAKQQRQLSAAAAAAAGAQPHLSCPGFQPLALPHQQQQPLQLYEQQVRQELEGQRLLNTATADAAAQRHEWAGPSSSGHTAYRTCLSPMRNASSSYAERMHDMQDHITALNRSLSADRKHSRLLKKQHLGKSRKGVDKGKAAPVSQSKRARPVSPQRRGKGVGQAGVLDLFDSEAESVDEAETSSSNGASLASSDRYTAKSQYAGANHIA